MASSINYQLFPMSEITDEARKIAVSWVENYEPMGYDLPGKQKLASDIMNYSKAENASLLTEVEALRRDNERMRGALGKILSDATTTRDAFSEAGYSVCKNIISIAQQALTIKKQKR